MATVELPGVGRVDRRYVVVGLAVVAGVVGYAWWSRAMAGGSGEDLPPVYDPGAPGATDYVNPGGSSDPVTVTPDGDEPIDTNARWTQLAVDQLAGVGFDAGFVATTLGKWLARQPLTSQEADVVRTARGLVGEPPVGGPYPINTTTDPPDPSGGGTPTGGPLSPPPAGSRREGEFWYLTTQADTTRGGVSKIAAAYYGNPAYGLNIYENNRPAFRNGNAEYLLAGRRIRLADVYWYTHPDGSRHPHYVR